MFKLKYSITNKVSGSYLYANDSNSIAYIFDPHEAIFTPVQTSGVFENEISLSI